MRWWGWGEDGHDVALPEHGAGHAARRARPGSGGRRRARLRSRRSSCPPRASTAPSRAAAGRRWWARSTCATTAPRASSTPPGAATRTCSGCAAGALGRRSGRRRRAGFRRRGAGAAERVRRGPRSRSCRSVAAASVVGGVDPVADGFPARDLARPAPPRPRGRRRPHVAHRDAGGRPVRPRAGAAARRRGRHARALPAVVRVLDRGRLGGDSLGWAGLDRLRPHRRARRGPADGGPGGRPEPPRRPRHRGRARTCASWWSARRACWA